MSEVSVNMGITAANGKKSSKAYTDIDPNASNADIKAFVTAANNLTTNTLTSVTKITKEDIDKTYSPIVITTTTDGNVTPTISGNTVSISAQDIITNAYVYAGTGDVQGDNFRYAYFQISIKANSVDVITDPMLCMSAEPASADITDVYFVTANSRSPDDKYQFSIHAASDTASKIVGYEWKVVIPGGNSGSTYWNKTTITFKIV